MNMILRNKIKTKLCRIRDYLSLDKGGQTILITEIGVGISADPLILLFVVKAKI